MPLASTTVLQGEVMQCGAYQCKTHAVCRPGGEVQEASTEALIREHLQDALAAGTEGLMLKALSGPAATYQPSKRSTHWLKIKR